MMRHKIKIIFFAIFILLSTITNVKAEEFIPTNKGSLSLNLSELETKQPIVGAKFAIYYIASVRQDKTSGELLYTYTDDYEECGILLTDSQLSTKLESVVNNKQYVSLLTTDNRGQAKISDLPLGLYFVRQINSMDGFALCQSFLVTLPAKENNKYIYDVDASPKTEIEKLISISIQKLWKADKNAKIPQDVTVQLYKDNVVIKTAVLNEKNNWKVVYHNLEKSDSYYIKEINIPKGYTPIYKQYDYSFTVTNVSSLINTGQLVWPIPILALTGIFCITVGLIVIRKTGKTHE